MTRIFLFYFRRNLLWTGLGLIATLICMQLLAHSSLVANPADTLRALWGVILLPAACLIVGATAGAEAGSPEASGAESLLPVSGFARLAGAAFAALLTAALLAAATVPISALYGSGDFLRGVTPSFYGLTLLQGCIYAFAFGRLSGSIFAGTAAGAALAALTTTGVIISIGVDAMIQLDSRLAYQKLWGLVFSAGCAFFSLKYISALSDRKAKPGIKTTGMVALLLSTGVLTAALMFTLSKRKAERMLIPAFNGDYISLAGYVVNPPHIPYDYSMLLNPVTEEIYRLGPDGTLSILMDGRKKSHIEFLRNPLNFIVHSNIIGENGETWALIKQNGLKLFYAEAGGKLKQAAELDGTGVKYPAVFRIGAKAYLAMRGKPDTMHYIAELIPGAKTLQWRLIGSGAAEAQRTILNMQKDSGAGAWLSTDGRKLLVRADGRRTEACSLPYAAEVSGKTYRPVRTANRELFFIPLVRNGKTKVYYCEKGKPALPAWDAPGYLPPVFFRNNDGSVYTSVSEKETSGTMFYILDDAGQFLPPLDAKKTLPGMDFKSAHLVRASAKELYFLLDDRTLVRTTAGGKPETMATWEGPPMAWRTVKDGIIRMHGSGTFLITWAGKNQRLY